MDVSTLMQAAWPHISSFSRNPNVVAAVGNHQRLCVDGSRAPTRATSVAAGPLLMGAAPATSNTNATPADATTSCFSIWMANASAPAASRLDVDTVTAHVVWLSAWWWRTRYRGSLKVCVAGLSTLTGQFDGTSSALQGISTTPLNGQPAVEPHGVTALFYNGSLKLFNVAALSAVGRCLRVLDLSQTSIRDEDLALVAVKEHGLIALESLNISQCKALTDINCLENVPTLRMLFFSNCLLITDEGIARLVALKRLEVVAMNVCKRISSVSALSASASLRELSCACTKLSDEGIQQLELVSSLRVVVFSVSPRITDVRRALSASYGLQRLSLNGTDATDAGMSGLHRSAPNLDELSISGCGRIATLAWVPTCVRVLDVSRCVALTDAGVHDFLGRMDRLEELNMSHNPSLTSVACLAACGRLRSVDVSFTMLRSVAAFGGWATGSIRGAPLNAVDVEACPIANRHEVVQLFHSMQWASALHWG